MLLISFYIFIIFNIIIFNIDIELGLLFFYILLNIFYLYFYFIFYNLIFFLFYSSYICYFIYNNKKILFLKKEGIFNHNYNIIKILMKIYNNFIFNILSIKNKFHYSYIIFVIKLYIYLLIKTLILTPIIILKWINNPIYDNSLFSFLIRHFYWQGQYYMFRCNGFWK